MPAAVAVSPPDLALSSRRNRFAAQSGIAPTLLQPQRSQRSTTQRQGVVPHKPGVRAEAPRGLSPVPKGGAVEGPTPSPKKPLGVSAPRGLSPVGRGVEATPKPLLARADAASRVLSPVPRGVSAVSPRQRPAPTPGARLTQRGPADAAPRPNGLSPRRPQASTTGAAVSSRAAAPTASAGSGSGGASRRVAEATEEVPPARAAVASKCAAVGAAGCGEQLTGSEVVLTAKMATRLVAELAEAYRSSSCLEETNRSVGLSWGFGGAAEMMQCITAQANASYDCSSSPTATA